jgi:hypothetical protein
MRIGAIVLDLKMSDTTFVYIDRQLYSRKGKER